MYLGRIMEIGPVEQIFTAPAHPYTAALLSAVPIPDPSLRRERVLLKGDIPSPINPPPGCLFHTRCPDCVAPCRATEQELLEVDPERPGHRAACHIHVPPAPNSLKPVSR
jgi:peptide/nickel transport system ATP-binding protein